MILVTCGSLPLWTPFGEFQCDWVFTRPTRWCHHRHLITNSVRGFTPAAQFFVSNGHAWWSGLKKGKGLVSLNHAIQVWGVPFACKKLSKVCQFKFAVCASSLYLITLVIASSCKNWCGDACGVADSRACNGKERVAAEFVTFNFKVCNWVRIGSLLFFKSFVAAGFMAMAHTMLGKSESREIGREGFGLRLMCSMAIDYGHFWRNFSSEVIGLSSIEQKLL